jgi:hypothetical protein
VAYVVTVACLRSARKAIVDYVLRDPATRERLRIHVLPAECTPHEWGGPPARRRIDGEPWHASVAAARRALTTGLYVTHPASRSLLALWREYSARRVVSLPTTDAESQKVRRVAGAACVRVVCRRSGCSSSDYESHSLCTLRH